MKTGPRGRDPARKTGARCRDPLVVTGYCVRGVMGAAVYQCREHLLEHAVLHESMEKIGLDVDTI